MGIVVVLHGVRVEQLAGVVRVVPLGLHPDGEIVLVVALSDELRKST
jgi:hypothetical protein